VNRTTVFLVLLAIGAWAELGGQEIKPQPGRLEPKATADGRRQDYVGETVCESCHQEKAESFHQTAHYLTSRPPSRESILGSFSPDANVLTTRNPNLIFRMEERNGEFFQTSVEGIAPDENKHSEKIALVFGSGGKGQTYAYWKGDQLFQLPVSYWRELGWVNSPGYRDGTANFDRPIIPRCLECHGTYFTALAPGPDRYLNRYKKNGFVVGIDCERCHGPGRVHSERYKQKTAAGVETGILNPARFSRERQLDLCGLCHAGLGKSVQPSFSYVAGEPLNQYVEFPAPDPNAPLDVHGSQIEALKKSRCFAFSKMTCLTCHDVHQPQHDLASFSERCLGCHKEQSCGIFATRGKQISNNCVDCHMPKQETNLIVFDALGKRKKPEVRNHWIKVYQGRPSGGGY
jgi:cytochrome c554/c'-like protein